MRPVQRVLGDEARIGVEIGGLRDLRIIRVLGALFEDVLGPEAIADVGVGETEIDVLCDELPVHRAGPDDVVGDVVHDRQVGPRLEDDVASDRSVVRCS